MNRYSIGSTAGHSASHHGSKQATQMVQQIDADPAAAAAAP